MSKKYLNIPLFNVTWTGFDDTVRCGHHKTQSHDRNTDDFQEVNRCQHYSGLK